MKRAFEILRMIVSAGAIVCGTALFVFWFFSFDFSGGSSGYGGHAGHADSQWVFSGGYDATARQWMAVGAVLIAGGWLLRSRGKE